MSDRRNIVDPSKPCPFCGSGDLLPSYHSSSHESFVCVACDNCDAEGPAIIIAGEDRVKAFHRAREAWNRRK